MAIGKDSDSRDGLGGVHKVCAPRPSVPDYPLPAAQGAEPVARGYRAGESHLVADPDQIARVVHTEPAPIDREMPDHAPASQEGGARTARAPFQDAHRATLGASAWEASPPTEPKV